MAGVNTPDTQSEVYLWLKSLSPGLKLERLSPEFEIRGFRSKRSLKYLQPGDLDSFFSSPNKLLLAERRILEDELNNINKNDSSLQPQKLDFSGQSNNNTAFPSSTSAHDNNNQMRFAGVDSYSPQSFDSTTHATTTSPLDRRAQEHTENLQVLSVKVASAKEQLTLKRKAMESISDTVQKKKACSICHKAGHNKSKCRGDPCVDANICKLPDKHPELQAEVRELQKELKELEQKYTKAKNENDVFLASRQRVRSSFFSVMRPRLKKQNLPKYIDRYALDRDLMVLQRALSGQIPPNESLDWRLPAMIEEYKRNTDTYRASFQPSQPPMAPNQGFMSPMCTQNPEFSSHFHDYQR